MTNLASFNLQQKLQAIKDVNQELEKTHSILRACEKFGYNPKSYVYWKTQLEPVLKLEERIIAQERELENLRIFRRHDQEEVDRLKRELSGTKVTHELQIKKLEEACELLRLRNQATQRIKVQAEVIESLQQQLENKEKAFIKIKDRLAESEKNYNIVKDILFQYTITQFINTINQEINNVQNLHTS